MWESGGLRRGRQLRRARSTGLAALLDEQETGNGVIVSSCMHDECSRWGLDRTLAHVLDVCPEVSFLTNDDKIDFSRVRSYLTSQLDSIGDAKQEDASTSGYFCDRDGVIINESPFGDGVVVMDSKKSCGDIKFDKRSLVLESQAIFSSARANACVWKGRWMYEATLGTAGIQQLGWATISCPFTNEEGVGDAADSYAFDGKRVRKWSENYAAYGQPWVSGDVIGCCLDLNRSQIIFYRNGTSLGVAYDNVRLLGPDQGYFPAISLSHGERCELNFGARPFKYPVEGFAALQVLPTVKVGINNECGLAAATARAKFLLGCLQRLVQLGSREVAAAMAPADRLRRYTPLTEEDVASIGHEICDVLQPLLLSPNLNSLQQDNEDDGGQIPSERSSNLKAPGEYVVWGALVPFLLETYRQESPHDATSVDQALDILLPRLEKQVGDGSLTSTIMEALAYGCRTAPFALADHPYTGPYPYLALACHLLERYDFMVSWWMSEGFELCLEGLLTRKSPNKNDLEALMPIVWWPGSREDLCSEVKMRHAATALSKASVKVRRHFFFLLVS
jgi:Kip1 ubiquitination-promoting complex protein 1